MLPARACKCCLQMRTSLSAFEVYSEFETIFGGGHCGQVRDVMTPLRDCFMLASNLRLNFQTMLAIYKSGGFRH